MTLRSVLNRLLVVGGMLYLSAGVSMAACLSGDALTGETDGEAGNINAVNAAFVELYNNTQAEGETPWVDVGSQYTDDATFAGTLQPFWLEGKAEVQDLWRRFFTAWPIRNIEFRHRRLCIYNGSAVETGFIEMYMGAKGKDTVITNIRFSRTWIKSKQGEWQIANMNVSRLPGH